MARKKTTPTDKPAKTTGMADTKKAKLLAKNAATLEDLAAAALIAARSMGIKTKPLDPQKEPGEKYPLCLEGELACPPDDVGGLGGFYEFLEALADPNHEQHDDFVEWGGDFDPQEFDARRATIEMQTGLPNWRRLR